MTDAKPGNVATMTDNLRYSSLKNQTIQDIYIYIYIYMCVCVCVCVLGCLMYIRVPYGMLVGKYTLLRPLHAPNHRQRMG